VYSGGIKRTTKGRRWKRSREKSKSFSFPPQKHLINNGILLIKNFLCLLIVFGYGLNQEIMGKIEKVFCSCSGSALIFASNYIRDNRDVFVSRLGR
jgi:hypothetical protein